MDSNKSALIAAKYLKKSEDNLIVVIPESVKMTGQQTLLDEL